MTADFAETNCTITHAGRQYTACGAYRNGPRALVYLCSEWLVCWCDVTDWHGNVLGRATVVSRWTQVSSRGEPFRYRAYRVVFTDGSEWHGRHCFDTSQACKLKLCKPPSGA